MSKHKVELLNWCSVVSNSNYGKSAVTDFKILHVIGEDDKRNALIIEVSTIINKRNIKSYQNDGYTISQAYNKIWAKKKFGIKVDTLIHGLKQLELIK